MRKNSHKARQKRRFKCATDSKRTFLVVLNILDQNFSAERPN
jgi:hypothetical protein